MANMIDLDPFPKLSYYSNFETRSISVIELTKGIFGPPLLIPLILKIPLLLKTGPVLMLFPMLILMENPPSSRVSCLMLM